MTTYTAITAGEIDADSPITTGLMTLLRDNPIAITEGSSGAPKIQNAALDTDSVTAAKIAAAAVGSSELATALTTAAGSLTGGTHDNISFNNYAFFPMFHANDIKVYIAGNQTDGGSGAAPRCGVYNDSASSITYDIDHRYMTTGT